jgi:uncharacterized protein
MEAYPDEYTHHAENQTLLHVIAAKGLAEICRIVINRMRPEDVNVQDNEGATALMHAASNGHREVVEALLKAKANVNVKDKDGSTALIRASSYGRAELVKVLLEAKADVNVQNKNGWTALILAAWAGHSQVVKMLLEAK